MVLTFREQAIKTLGSKLEDIPGETLREEAIKKEEKKLRRKETFKKVRKKASGFFLSTPSLGRLPPKGRGSLAVPPGNPFVSNLGNPFVKKTRNPFIDER